MTILSENRSINVLVLWMMIYKVCVSLCIISPNFGSGHIQAALTSFIIHYGSILQPFFLRLFKRQMKLESISDIKKNISNQPTAGLMNDEYKCFQRLSLYACFVVVGFAGIRFAIIVKSNLRSSSADKKKNKEKISGT